MARCIVALVCTGCRSRMHRLGGLDSRPYFSSHFSESSGDWKSKITMLEAQFLGRTPPGLQAAALSLWVHLVGQERLRESFPVSLLMRALS